MTTDPLTLAGDITREVRNGERDGRPTKVAVARRTYATDRGDLWQALTHPERIARWFSPVTGELREGGRYQVEGNASGVVERCTEPESFAVTWEMGPMVSWLEVRLVEGGAGTVLELEHEAPVDPEMWQQFGPGAVGVGWDLSLLGLEMHLSTGEPVPDEVKQTYTLGEEGGEFVRRSASGWSEAAVAAGDDATLMESATEAVVAFYTTPPEGPLA